MKRSILPEDLNGYTSLSTFQKKKFHSRERTFFAALSVPAERTGAFVWLIAYAAMHAGRVA